MCLQDLMKIAIISLFWIGCGRPTTTLNLLYFSPLFICGSVCQYSGFSVQILDQSILGSHYRDHVCFAPELFSL
jgi:hypothetical protein